MSSTGPLTCVNAPDGPPVLGPYSHGVATPSLLFCSGALPVDPVTGVLVDGGLAKQAEQCLANLEATCRAAGTSLSYAVRLTIYTTRLESFGEINAGYAQTMGSHAPARVTIGVAALPGGAELEIDAVVALPGNR